MDDLRCLTVHQPWAWAIFHGKSVENRVQMMKYRGPLAIHSGQRLSERGCREIPDLLDAHEPDEALRAYAEADLPYGAILGVVTLYDVHRAARDCCDSPWGEHGPRTVHLRLGGAIEFPEPITGVRGRLGLWKPDEDLHALIQQRTREAA